MYSSNFLSERLLARENNNALRKLQLPSASIDFCSNDYLGIATNNLLHIENNSFSSGSKGSRLLAGNYKSIEDAEKMLAKFHEVEGALIFNSGYDANIGLLSSVPQKADIIIYDFLVHASIRDGIRLSAAQSFSFLHNDMEDLARRLRQLSSSCNGQVFVVTESVFSMDGDMAPLQEIVTLCKQFNVYLIVDEAHATGVIGDKGEGLVQHLKLTSYVFARVHTFGKACGCHGAVVLGSSMLIQYLINFARSFIYTTALPETTIKSIINSYALISDMKAERMQLQKLISVFQLAEIKYQKLVSLTPIQGIVVGDNTKVKTLANDIQLQGFDIRPILYPTVEKGKERLRIILHSFNTINQLEQFISVLNKN